ncbi:MAG TPA: hypothetical protein IAB47_04175 [Candidatus Scatomorpha merdigallinarum]|nr:hypothetical protein [Candidatus Scatomorpha merdigallinarum]
MFVLVLECSTSSAKAMYYDTEHESYDVCSRPYEPDFPGELTLFNPEHVFEQMLAVGREIVRGRRVDIIALCSAWHSIGLFDKKFCPVTPMYQWSNNLGDELCTRYRDDASYTQQYYETTGCMVNAIYPFFKLKKLSESLDLGKYCAMGQGSYNNCRITGNWAVTDCMLSGSGLMNTHELTYDAALLEELGLSRQQLPPVCTYRDQFTLCEEAAKKLGIGSGIPVIATCADGALNHTGSGALHAGTMTFSVGTSGAMRMVSERPKLSPQGRTWCYRSPSTWLVGAATNGATNCLDWFKKLAFGDEVTYSEIENDIKTLQNTPVFLPFVFGERCPGWRDGIRGGFKNLCPQHDLYDMYLGIEEGILFNLYQCYLDLIQEHGEPDHIRLSGGILNSKLWSQMCADIFGRTIEIDPCKHASLMGGVILAKERLKIIESIEGYALPPTGCIEPDLDKRAMYKDKFEKYLEFYNEL